MTSMNSWDSEFNSAKGALLVGNATRPVVLPVGADTQVLTADSTQVTGTRWATNAAVSGFTSVVQQVFTANGTYTPTVGMKYCTVTMVGGGGGGGTVQAAIPDSFASGGGGGEFAQGFFSAATIGISQAVTIGVGGSGAIPAAGGTTSLGALLTCIGGSAGQPGVAPIAELLGGAGGTGGVGGILHIPGCRGGTARTSPSFTLPGGGGDSLLGFGFPTRYPTTPSTLAGLAGTGYGSGGSGASNFSGVVFNQPGGNGAPGIIIIQEYI